MKEQLRPRKATLGPIDMENTRILTVSEARNQFADLVSSVFYSRQAAVITKNGKKTVAVVPYEILERLAALEALNDITKATNALDDYRRNGGVALDDLKKELEIE
jgi:prevent-host-death family protein